MVKDVGDLRTAAAPLLSSASSSLEPMTDQLRTALEPTVRPIADALGNALQPAAEAIGNANPALREQLQSGGLASGLFLVIAMVAGFCCMMRCVMRRWESRRPTSRFGRMKDPEAGGVLPLLGESRVRSSAPPALKGAAVLPFGSGPPPIRIAATVAGDTPLTTARGPGSSRFMRVPAAECSDPVTPKSSRWSAQTPRSVLQTPRSTAQETPRTPTGVQPPSRFGVPKIQAAASAARFAGSMRGSALASARSSDIDVGALTARTTGRGSLGDSPTVRRGHGESTALAGYLAVMSTPGRHRIHSLMSSTPRSARGGDHKLQVAFELTPAGWDFTETATPAERLLPTYLRPVPPEMRPVDEVFFILHATGVQIESPLTDEMKETWVRNAISFGAFLSNNHLRTRDIYRLADQQSVFDEQQFVVYVPVELNPQLTEDVSVVHNLFRLGSQQTPVKKQIVQLPVQWALSEEGEEQLQQPG